ncbi:MAG: pantothenate kinase [Congregibacter sp.]
MPTYLIDIGNTAAKWMRFDGESITDEGACSAEHLRDLIVTGSGGAASDAEALIGSVRGESADSEFAAGLNEAGIDAWFATSRAALGRLTNAYAEPERMGVDRWLAMLAASALTDRAFCVVDAGSALTIDLVNSSGRHLGGYIIPGAAMMQGALLANTDRVRFDPVSHTSIAPGCSTAEAVHHGLLLAQCGAVRLALSQAHSQLEDDCEVFFCGGGGGEIYRVLAQRNDLPGFRLCERPGLVFEGLLRQAMHDRPAFVSRGTRFLQRLGVDG